MARNLAGNSDPMNVKGTKGCNFFMNGGLCFALERAKYESSSVCCS